jgi:hypothetical protein
MDSTLDHLKSALPPVGAGLVGWPWWAVAIVLLISYGPAWVMAWLDVLDRVRGRTPPAS